MSKFVRIGNAVIRKKDVMNVRIEAISDSTFQVVCTTGYSLFIEDYGTLKEAKEKIEVAEATLKGVSDET